MRSANPTTAIASLYLNPNDFHQHIRLNHNGSTDTENDTLVSGKRNIGGAASYIGGTQLIKICGITNVTDALIACQAGANLIGIIFVTASQRCVESSQQALEIVNAVRQFGERNDRIEGLHSMDSSTITDPIQHIVRSTMSIVQTAKHRPLVVGVFQNQEQLLHRFPLLRE